MATGNLEAINFFVSLSLLLSYVSNRSIGPKCRLYADFSLGHGSTDKSVKSNIEFRAKDCVL